MVRYEVLMLTIPEVTEDEIKGIESQLLGILRSAKGTLVSFERWGKYRLCYSIKKNEYGVYFLIRFELPNDDAKNTLNTLDEIKALINVKFYDIIMRSMFSVLDANQTLVYQRPTSLEEAPRREGSFLRPSRHAESRASDGVTLDEETDIEEDDYEGSERVVAE